MRRVLVIANQTLLDEPLLDAIREEAARGPVRFSILVPAVDATPPGSLVWEEHRAWATADARLRDALARIAALGFDADGRVGGHDALSSALDVLREEPYDAVIVSTLPPGLSRWLGMDLPSRLARATRLPVRHVVGQAAMA